MFNRPMDPKSPSPLQIFAKYAYERYINLDGRIQRHEDSCLTGGFAIVYKGTLLPEGTSVAVKTIGGTLPKSEKIIKEGVREVHTWSKLRHANILPLLGITTEFDRTISIVSPWMDKGNAHDYVQDRTIDPLPLLAGVAHGLQYLHECKPYPIFHGDLKGVNVLISQEGQALLTDFGLSHAVNSSLKITLNTPCGGTLNWMAPELLDGGVVSAQGDVWAFGMAALELFTAKDPFHDCKTAALVMARILKGPPPRPSMEDTSFRLTDELWDLCRSCWNPHPNLRPPISGIANIFSKYVIGIETASTNQGTRVLRICAIEISSVRGGHSAELRIGGQTYKICEQVGEGVIRADFEPVLESAMQEQFSLLVASQALRTTQSTKISFDPRDVLARLQDNKFSEVHGNLSINMEVCLPADAGSLIPTTDELLSQCPYFRILVIGKTGVGKTTLISCTFGVEGAEPSHNKRGIAYIEKPLVSKLNQRFILHDSKGFEPGEVDNLTAVKAFIKGRKNHEDIKEQIHAVWLSFQIPLESHGQRMMEAGMEDFLRQKRDILGNIPTVFVFTKYDRLTDSIESKWIDERRDYTDEDVTLEADRYIREHCVQRIQKFTGEQDIIYIAVSTKLRYRVKLKQLIKLTSDNVSEHFVQRQGNGSSAVSTVTIMAQRVNPILNISESANVGKQRYWEAVFSGFRFSGRKILDCLQVIHTDIVKVWNFCDPNELLLNKDFRENILELVDLIECDRQNDVTVGGLARMLAALKQWRDQNWTRGPREYRKFMAYIVDLTHIMDILFTLTDRESNQEVSLSTVRVAINAYRHSSKMRDVHTKICAFTNTSSIISASDLTSAIDALVNERYDTDASLKSTIEKEKTSAGGRRARNIGAGIRPSSGTPARRVTPARWC